jgi:four helix bundle protein
MASCSEVKSMLFLAERLKYINEARKENLLQSADEVSRLIRGLMKSLKK